MIKVLSKIARATSFFLNLAWRELKSTEVYEPSVRQPWQQSHKMLELYNGLNIFNDVI
jgi:hypothetical protein